MVATGHSNGSSRVDASDDTLPGGQPSPQTCHQVQSGVSLDVVVIQSASIDQFLASVEDPLLIWQNASLFLHQFLQMCHRIRLMEKKKSIYKWGEERYDDSSLIQSCKAYTKVLTRNVVMFSLTLLLGYRPFGFVPG